MKIKKNKICPYCLIVHDRQGHKYCSDECAKKISLEKGRIKKPKLRSDQLPLPELPDKLVEKKYLLIEKN